MIDAATSNPPAFRGDRRTQLRPLLPRPAPVGILHRAASGTAHRYQSATASLRPSSEPGKCATGAEANSIALRCDPKRHRRSLRPDAEGLRHRDEAIRIQARTDAKRAQDAIDRLGPNIRPKRIRTEASVTPLTSAFVAANLTNDVSRWRRLTTFYLYATISGYLPSKFPHFPFGTYRVQFLRRNRLGEADGPSKRYSDQANYPPASTT